MHPSDHSMAQHDVNELAIEWLVKLRSGNLSEHDARAFADWLAQDGAHAASFAKAEAFLSEMTVAVNLPRPLDGEIKPDALTNAQGTMVIKPIASRKSWLAIPIALAAAWLVAVGLVLPSQSDVWDDLLSDYHTRTGEIRDVTLADGSHLQLNTNTAVSVRFSNHRRLVTLHHGQARFSVAKDAARPFEVEANSLTFRALGTVFDVYKQSHAINVIVQEHAITARVREDNKTVTIQAGQQWRYQGELDLPQPVTINLAQASAWQQHRLFINDRPLSELIEEVGRYRLGRIYLADKQLNNLRVTGVFPLDNPDDIITSVRKVLGLQLTRLGPWWVLHR
jgi:transmembrane sensor